MTQDNFELPINPPNESLAGHDWQGLELYGYEDGFVIDGEFVPEEDAIEYLTAIYGTTTAEEVFGG